MKTTHKLIIANCSNMPEINSQSVELILSSPPYFNAPFDYANLYPNYEDYLNLITNFAKESYRVLKHGRIATVNIDDMLVKSEKFPIVADTTKIFINAGFRYRDRIIWKKPDGYLRISRRSGVLLQNPYPMYFYPDNLIESIIIFQKDKFNYKTKTKKEKENSQINTKEFLNHKWYTTLWEMTNVLPNSKLEKGIAAFPEELAYRIIKLFSYKGETVLDPFLGSGTTMKVAKDLKRNSIGIEIKEELLPIIKEKLGFGKNTSLFKEESTFQLIRRTKLGYRNKS